MKKYILALCVVTLMMVLTATAFGFSLALRDLHITTASFAQPLVAPAMAAPMTSSDESEIAAPPAEQIRMEQVQQPAHVCQRDHAPEHQAGF